MTSGGPARDPRLCDVRGMRRNIRSRGSLPSKEPYSEALLIRGLKDGPPRVRQTPQITRVRDSMDVPYKLPSNAMFETSYVVFKASRGCLARGIPSRESIEPSDSI
jgi:hypothetical protein